MSSRRPRLFELIAPQQCGSYRYSVECLREHLDERKPLDAEHWQETERYRHGLGLNMDYDRLLAYDDIDQSLWFVMRKDGALVGHAYFFLFRDTHDQQLSATEDVIFIRPEHRVGRNCVSFGLYWKRAARQIGVRKVELTRKLDNPRAERFFEFLGAKPVAVQYSMIIE